MFTKSTILAAILILVCGTIGARDMDRVTERIDAKGAKDIRLSIDFGAGEVEIASGDIDEAAVLDVEYDPKYVDYQIEYKLRGKTGYLDLESIQRRKRDVDTDRNKWTMTLSKKYPMSISMDMGACEALIDLGGVPVTDLSIDIGAASGVLEFSKPNPERLDEIDIDAGAASMECINLGNANFEYCKFSGGAGSFDLDFRGKYSGESEIKIDIGLGSADIVLPEGVPVRVISEGSGFLSSVDFHNDDLDEVDDDIYESPDFDDADTRIIIEIDVGLGSVDVYWK